MQHVRASPGGRMGERVRQKGEQGLGRQIVLEQRRNMAQESPGR